ncbi:MAG: cyclodeaminase/cyclohydrolase family protein, partial [Fusobacteriaceae bacterium]|nr:cyclodeaminase/cyclohydrolase family protein [Fusobacteriaceae bacterium]
MELSGMSLKEYMNVLESDAPAPGGGSAAAVAGAQGCALTAMVCALSLGKVKYEAFEPLLREVREKTLSLQKNFLEVTDRDTKTFAVMTAVFAMPKSTEQEKSAKKLAMQNALKVCTEPPMDMMRFALQALEAAAKITGKSNETAASDLGVAALNLKAALQGAWLNVLINI